MKIISNIKKFFSKKYYYELDKLLYHWERIIPIKPQTRIFSRKFWKWVIISETSDWKYLCFFKNYWELSCKLSRKEFEIESNKDFDFCLMADCVNRYSTTNEKLTSARKLVKDLEKEKEIKKQVLIDFYDRVWYPRLTEEETR